MNMVTLRSSGIVVLMVIAVWVCVRYRRLFLIQRGPVMAVRLLGGVLCLALLGVASWAGYYAVTISTGWARNALYTFLPIIVMTSYVYPIFQFKELPKEWKRSPLLILAMLAPILGCIVISGVWWCEVGRPRYIQIKAQMEAAGKQQT
jgi:hypothetical protein